MAICFSRFVFLRTLLAAVLVFIAAIAARAQEPPLPQSSPMDALAAKMADAISQGQDKTVTVFDFQGPDYKFTELGQRLADEFSAALSKSTTNLTVMNRLRVPADDGELAVLADHDFSYERAQEIRADGLVLGKLSLEGEDLSVKVEFCHTSNRKKLFDFSAVIPLTDEMIRLLRKHVGENAFSNYPRGGDKGYSQPSCIYCRRADMTDELVKHVRATGRKYDGSVVLEVLVEVDGSIQNIRVLKELPYGLTDKAVGAAQKWKFKPATGPDGRPVTVAVPIEVQFHLH